MSPLIAAPISLWNNAPDDGSLGNMTGVTISGNQIIGDGSAASYGIRLLGLSTGVSIIDNYIDAVTVGILQMAYNGHAAAETQIGQADNGNDIESCDTGVQILAGSAVIDGNTGSIYDNRVGIDVNVLKR